MNSKRISPIVSVLLLMSMLLSAIPAQAAGAAEGACDAGWESTNQPRYTLSTSVVPPGTGGVSPGGGTYPEGTRLTLTVGAASGWEFDHWGGDVSGTSPSVTITMDRDKHVIAYFVIPEERYTLSTSVSPPGSGSINPSSGTYDKGTRVTLTAYPNSGWEFDKWGGDVSGTSPSVTITMDRDKHVIAYFVEIGLELSIDVWTDKGGRGHNVPDGTYHIGNPITIYKYVNKACTAQIKIHKPDGTVLSLGPWQFSRAGEYPLTGLTIGQPIGERTINFEAWTDSERAYDTCVFQVEEEDLALSIDVWTDKGGQGYNVPDGRYNIGDPITIYKSVNKDCTARINYQKADFTVISLGPWQLSAGVHPLTGLTVEGPAGTHGLIFEAWTDSEKAYDDCWFEVNGELADLVISDISWSPRPPKVGDEIAISFTVENIGDGTAYDFVQACATSPREFSGKNYQIDSLARDEIKTFIVRFVIDEEFVQRCKQVHRKSGFMFITGADFKKKVSESDEGNNDKEVWIPFEEEEEVPKLCVVPDPSSHDFGRVPEGEQRAWIFQIENCGDGTLEWQVSVDKPWITVKRTSGTITAGQESIEVTIDTSGLSGSNEGTLSITSNGGSKQGIIEVWVGSPVTLYRKTHYKDILGTFKESDPLIHPRASSINVSKGFIAILYDQIYYQQGTVEAFTDDDENLGSDENVIGENKAWSIKVDELPQQYGWFNRGLAEKYLPTLRFDGYDPNVIQEGSEPYFPVKLNYDGDDDITNNKEWYTKFSIGTITKTRGWWRWKETRECDQYPAVYVQPAETEEKKYQVIEYWYYYTYNFYTAVEPHRHDFEAVFVYLQKEPNDDFRPVGIRCSCHDFDPVWFEWDAVKTKEGRGSTHCVLGVEHGGHAMANWVNQELITQDGVIIHYDGRVKEKVGRLDSKECGENGKCPWHILCNSDGDQSTDYDQTRFVIEFGLLKWPAPWQREEWYFPPKRGETAESEVAQFFDLLDSYFQEEPSELTGGRMPTVEDVFYHLDLYFKKK